MSLRRAQQRLMAGGGSPADLETVLDAAIAAAVADSGGTVFQFAARKESFTNGQSVATWTEQQSGIHNLTQGTALRQPTYYSSGIGGRPTLRFNQSGVSNNSFGEWVAPNCYVLVFQGTSWSSSGSSVFTRAVSGDYNTFLPYSSPTVWRMTDEAGNIVGSQTDTDPHVAVLMFDGVNSYMRIDDTTWNTSTFGQFQNGLDGLTVGANAAINSLWFQGDLSEWIGFDVPPSASAIEGIVDALQGYYGL